MKRHINRIRLLEARMAKSSNPGRRMTDAEWFAIFEGLGRQGWFDGEPDYPHAIDAYKRAVHDAGASSEPLSEWEWLAEMYQRVSDDRPPLTEAEFRELVEWFEEYEKRLSPEDRGNLINLRCSLARGPRALRVTEAVEAVRRLRDGLA